MSNAAGKRSTRGSAQMVSASLFALWLAFSLSVAAAQNVLTNHNDNARTGANLKETCLTTSNVTDGKFGKLFSLTVDGQIYAQPLYLQNVAVPNKGTHNVLYIATQHGSLYAFDADDNSGPNNAPLWRACLSEGDSGSRAVDTAVFDVPLVMAYKDLVPEIGITSTPVISCDGKVIYVVAASVRRGTHHQFLYALDTASGKKVSSTEIEWKGKKADASGPPLPFNPRQQMQRAGLLHVPSNRQSPGQDGVIYVAFGSHGDLPINAISLKNFFNLLPGYHGWVFAYDAKTLKRLAVYNSTPKARDRFFSLITQRTPAGGGIWMSGAGPSADGNGNVYFSTGNGTFTLDKHGTDYGDSLVKLRLAGDPSARHFEVADFFAPHNQADLNKKDLDLGSSGVLLIPDQSGGQPQMAVVGGKEGFLYLLDRDKLGGYDKDDKDEKRCLDAFLAAYATEKTQKAVRRMGNVPIEGRSRVQQTQAHMAMTKSTGENNTISNIHSAPVYWQTPTLGPYVYIWGEEDFLKGFPLKNAKLLHGDHDVARSLGKLSPGMPGAFLSISANESKPGTGILWALHPYRGDANHETVPGVLRAFDATPDLSGIGGPILHELWASRPTRESPSNRSGRAFTADDLGDFAKFCPPTIANGKVYVATLTCQLEVYGLYKKQPTILPAIADAYVQAGDLADLTMRDRHDFLPIDERLKLKEKIVLQRVSDDSRSRDNRCGYLLFDLTGVHDTPRSAMLTLTIDKGTPTTKSAIIKVYGIDEPAWSEELLTWNNAPGLERAGFRSQGSEIASHRVFYNKGTVTFDLTEFVANHLGRFVTLQLMSDRTGYLSVDFKSSRKEFEGKPGGSSPPSEEDTILTAGDPILVLTWF